MKDYTQYQLDDFVQDPYFRRWALGKLDPDDSFWTTWRGTHPEQYELIEQAKTVVLALRVNEESVDEADVRQHIHQILDDTQPTRIVPLLHQPLLRWAASVLLIAGISYWAWTNYGESGSPAISHQRATLPPATQTPNSETQSQIVWLTDGSKVTLSRSSHLRVSPDFGQTERVVYLTGEAFFDVTKDPTNPFWFTRARWSRKCWEPVSG